MATSLFKMPFDIEKTKIRQIYRSEELEKARKEWNRRLEQCPAEQRPWLVLQYANPVLNQYRIKQQS